jgi:hypothetical protein
MTKHPFTVGRDVVESVLTGGFDRSLGIDRPAQVGRTVRSVPGASITTLTIKGRVIGEVRYTRQAQKWWWRIGPDGQWHGMADGARKADAEARVLAEQGV